MSRLLIVLALAGSIGLHWTFLQSVAWVGMVVTYSRDASVGEALEKTFDGQHPCKLCKRIAKGKAAEKKAAFQIESSKLKFAYSPTVFISLALPLLWEASAFNDSPELLTHAPPVPPPRLLTA